MRTLSNTLRGRGLRWSRTTNWCEWETNHLLQVCHLLHQVATTVKTEVPIINLMLSRVDIRWHTTKRSHQSREIPICQIHRVHPQSKLSRGKIRVNSIMPNQMVEENQASQSISKASIKMCWICWNSVITRQIRKTPLWLDWLMPPSNNGCMTNWRDCTTSKLGQILFRNLIQMQSRR